MFGFTKKTPSPYLSAVIVVDPHFILETAESSQGPIDEFSVVIRAVAAFESCSRVREIILVCREEAIPDYYALVQDYNLTKVACVVGGGENRQESAFRGVVAVSAETAFLLLHDGARPLVEPQVIDDCINAAFTHGAAAAGVPVQDTIKIHKDGFIVSTPNRAELAVIQTPQVFEISVYRRAMEMAKQSARYYVDDCQMVEAAGHSVFISQGSFENIKVNTSEDLLLADAILTNREKGAGGWL